MTCMQGVQPVVHGWYLCVTNKKFPIMSDGKHPIGFLYDL
jgi:hypothetical protein